MDNEFDPIVGNWYRELGDGLYFTVVAIDPRDRSVEIQHFDGDIEEWAFSEWSAHEIEIAEPPEDWTGPVDGVAPNVWDDEVELPEDPGRLPAGRVRSD